MKNKLLHTPDGVRDLYNEDYKKKLDIQNKLHHVFAEYGCIDIQTPTFEYFDVFSNQIAILIHKCGTVNNTRVLQYFRC